jgi:hypothetical protein
MKRRRCLCERAIPICCFWYKTAFFCITLRGAIKELLDEGGKRRQEAKVTRKHFPFASCITF